MREPLPRARGPGEQAFAYSWVTYPLVTYPLVTYRGVTYSPVTEQAFARIRDRLTRLDPPRQGGEIRLTRLEPRPPLVRLVRHGAGETRLTRLEPHSPRGSPPLTRLEPRGRMAAYWRGRARGLAHNDPIWPPEMPRNPIKIWGISAARTSNSDTIYIRPQHRGRDYRT